MAGLLAATSALLQLLTRPVLGLADNGDFKRLLAPLGLVAALPKGQAPKEFVVLDYVPGKVREQAYDSTELVLLRGAARAARAFGGGPGLDLRVLGVTHALLLGIAVWLVVRALPGPFGVRAVTSLLLVVVVTDTRFVVYFDSFYTEPASMLALLFLVAAVLHAWRRPETSPAALLAMSVAGLALVLDKSQDAVLVLPIAVLLLARPVPLGRLRGPFSGRVLPGLCAVALLVAAGVYVQRQPAYLDQSNRYNAVFVEILGHTDDPPADLRALGLDPRLAPYAGRAIYLPHNATKDPAFGNFFGTATHERIAVFYLQHPGRALSLATRGADAAMDLVPRGVSPSLGNETRADSPSPVYDACKLCLYSTVSRGLRRAAGVLMPALWLAAGAVVWRLRRVGESDRAADADGGGTDGLVAALLLLLAVTPLAMAVALLGEGAFEIVKHLYLGSVGNALLFVLVVHGAALLIGRVVSYRPWEAC